MLVRQPKTYNSLFLCGSMMQQKMVGNFNSLDTGRLHLQRNSTFLITYKLTNQSAQRAVFTNMVYIGTYICYDIFSSILPLPLKQAEMQLPPLPVKC